MVTKDDALALLRTAMADESSEFRSGQWEAIEAIATKRGRVLCVQRTGWGKSMVYFVAAKLLRLQGAGPTIIISPLLALMRNQIEAANRLGLRAETINSTNTDAWPTVRRDLLRGSIDLLLISPERLANDEFVTDVLQPIAGSIALLVIDEAHCISDWGHDFRPDYRRIGQILALLPGNISVLGTTATANRRVQQDVSEQLGGSVAVQRGPLVRSSLALQHIRLNNPAERLAWLADNLPGIDGSGIVYALTQRDADRVAAWLRSRGIDACAYHADKETEDKLALEQRLLANEIKCLVATTALGMGYDKPDLSFVVHYQTPSSVVAYYQQVGRAGRGISKAYGVLLSGEEEDDINEYFRETAFPPEWQVEQILNALAEAENGLTKRELEGAVNIKPSHIEKVLKLLVVEQFAPVMKIGSSWYRTANPYRMDKARVEHLTRQRELEWAEMKAYQASQTCLMEFLAKALDDENAAPCGKCAVCLGQPLLLTQPSRESLIAAQRFVRRSEMLLEPKKQWDVHALPRYRATFGWPVKLTIPERLRAEQGRILSRWGEPIWGELVRQGKAEGYFSDELVAAAAETIRERWPMQHPLKGICCVPSMRHPRLVPNFAQRLAAEVGVPLVAAVEKVRETEAQKGMENRFHQCHNLDGAFRVRDDLLPPGALLLVDDVSDSGWTLALIAALLRQAGATAVYPFALSSSATK
ncbi:RecQ family ATP-dependent DNA helicase [Aromatoleum evansii]|uniref:DNA 3'-5' helicase n=1 Tax=Aromatoleum evansii TaxID=59406 RepID=A0ABZ1AIV6_AROEV|nr:RecQ family ATP-dependent DNA helicase [Aromatoleum evansii]